MGRIICVLALLGSMLYCVMSTWLSWNQCFPDTCFLYDSSLGLAQRGICIMFGGDSEAVQRRRGAFLCTQKMVMERAAPDEPQKGWILVCSMSTLSCCSCLCWSMAATGQLQPQMLAYAPAEAMANRGNRFPLQDRLLCHLHLATGYTCCLRVSCKLWIFHLG